MDIQINHAEGGIKVALYGQFTFADNRKFKEILDLFKDRVGGFVELDFSQVDFIDSAGLGMLLLLRDSCQNHNFSVSLHAPQGQVEKIFTVSKFDQLFSITS